MADPTQESPLHLVVRPTGCGEAGLPVGRELPCQVGRGASIEHDRERCDVSVGRPCQTSKQRRVEGLGFHGNGCDRAQASRFPLIELDDIPADLAATQRDSDDRPYPNDRFLGGWNRIPKAIVDREGRDRRDDASGGDGSALDPDAGRCGFGAVQRASAALRSSGATTVDSHGNSDRPKWPYAAVGR